MTKPCRNPFKMTSQSLASCLIEGLLFIVIFNSLIPNTTMDLAPSPNGFDSNFRKVLNITVNGSSVDKKRRHTMDEIHEMCFSWDSNTCQCVLATETDLHFVCSNNELSIVPDMPPGIKKL
jgi:hypothetical protein